MEVIFAPYGDGLECEEDEFKIIIASLALTTDKVYNGMQTEY